MKAFSLLSSRARRLRWGSSLLETVFALFLMTAVLIMSFQLFHNASSWQADSEDRLTAVWLAESKLEELRIAAKNLEQFRSSLASFRGTSTPAGHSNYKVTVDTSEYGAANLYSPSTSYEVLFQQQPVGGQFPSVTDDRRSMTSSALAATVTVSWNNDREQPITLSTLLREPPRTTGRVEISQFGDSDLAYGEFVRFSAIVWDAEDRLVEDAVVSWTLVPVAGYGTVYQTRNGHHALLRYVDFDFNGLEYQPPPGTCRVRAVAKIEGREVEQMTDLINLGP